MKKIAIFVEGQTERLFTNQLVRHIFGHSNVEVKMLKLSGKEWARTVDIIDLVDVTHSKKYSFHIYDCQGGGNKSTVKSDIINQFPILVNGSFSYVIGIRDVYPQKDVNRLRANINREPLKKPQK